MLLAKKIARWSKIATDNKRVVSCLIIKIIEKKIFTFLVKRTLVLLLGYWIIKTYFLLNIYGNIAACCLVEIDHLLGYKPRKMIFRSFYTRTPITKFLGVNCVALMPSELLQLSGKGDYKKN